jgi:hypothetical protein
MLPHTCRVVGVCQQYYYFNSETNLIKYIPYTPCVQHTTPILLGNMTDTDEHTTYIHHNNPTRHRTPTPRPSSVAEMLVVVALVAVVVVLVAEALVVVVAGAGSVGARGCFRLRVGGRVEVCSARQVKAASTAPAAPSKWPVAPLVEDTSRGAGGGWGAVRAGGGAENTASSSARSPLGVEVACAMRYAMRSGESPPASCRATAIARPAPPPSSGGEVMWCASPARHSSVAEQSMHTQHSTAQHIYTAG